MRLKTQNCGNVHEAINFVTKTQTETYFHSVVPLSGGSGSIIIWRFEGYISYCCWAERLRLKEIATESEFLNGGPLK
jgi:hypothetical protein